MTDSEAVLRHYKGADDVDSMLVAVSKFIDALEPPLTVDKLAGLDQFHVGGLAATRQLALFAGGIERHMHVLDAGSGLGGPSRFLAEFYGCNVTGVDLSLSFVAIAGLLAERTGLAGKIIYEVGDLLALPHGDYRFDVVWTQHVAMNIPNRDALYAAFRRMLRPNGRLIFYDVIAADEKAHLHFPVPWASIPESSFLLTETETRAALGGAGFEVLAWDDVTVAARTWTQQARPAPGLSLGAVMGARFPEMIKNLMRNIDEGHLRLVMAVCR